MHRRNSLRRGTTSNHESSLDELDGFRSNARSGYTSLASNAPTSDPSSSSTSRCGNALRRSSNPPASAMDSGPPSNSNSGLHDGVGPRPISTSQSRSNPQWSPRTLRSSIQIQASALEHSPPVTKQSQATQVSDSSGGSQQADEDEDEITPLLQRLHIALQAVTGMQQQLAQMGAADDAEAAAEALRMMQHMQQKFAQILSSVEVTAADGRTGGDVEVELLAQIEEGVSQLNLNVGAGPADDG
ncbi:hypothetical protein N0V83_000038 [Neocucurbitaria cava]|uniref:Uncharacterized protein n=1 Tax=Neocucurbitaria cava TaxID=798079 RepID=A0A9W8YFL5_9PLEO|nr:hypothetical protein N0V83_000038 [Neocucurbitaria cava]